MSPVEIQYKAADLPEERGDEIKFIASTPRRDRYGDVVTADWQLGEYRKNPVVLWGHDADKVIGNASGVEVDKQGRLVASIKFVEAGLDPDIDLARALVQRGYVKAMSVGFLPHKVELIRDDEDTITGFRFSQNELVELSVVSVPANPDALAFAKSLNVPDESAARVFRACDAALFLAKKQRRVSILRALAR